VVLIEKGEAEETRSRASADVHVHIIMSPTCSVHAQFDPARHKPMPMPQVTRTVCCERACSQAQTIKHLC
jgi:hypothetical protein